MLTAAAVIPSIATQLPFTRAADAIALIGLLATARVFPSLAAMDVGHRIRHTGRAPRNDDRLSGGARAAGGDLRRFTDLRHHGAADHRRTSFSQAFALNPSLAFTAVAFTMVLLAENASIPVDNPATHLELTMIHEALLLEYSARHLALMEWAAALKLFNYACIGIAVFIPWGIATGHAPWGWPCPSCCSP